MINGYRLNFIISDGAEKCDFIAAIWAFKKVRSVGNQPVGRLHKCIRMEGLVHKFIKVYGKEIITPSIVFIILRSKA